MTWLASTRCATSAGRVFPRRRSNTHSASSTCCRRRRRRRNCVGRQRRRWGDAAPALAPAAAAAAAAASSARTVLPASVARGLPLPDAPPDALAAHSRPPRPTPQQRRWRPRRRRRRPLCKARSWRRFGARPVGAADAADARAAAATAQRSGCRGHGHGRWFVSAIRAHGRTLPRPHRLRRPRRPSDRPHPVRGAAAHAGTAPAASARAFSTPVAPSSMPTHAASASSSPRVPSPRASLGVDVRDAIRAQLTAERRQSAVYATAAATTPSPRRTAGPWRTAEVSTQCSLRCSRPRGRRSRQSRRWAGRGAAIGAPRSVPSSPWRDAGHAAVARALCPVVGGGYGGWRRRAAPPTSTRAAHSTRRASARASSLTHRRAMRAWGSSTMASWAPHDGASAAAGGAADELTFQTWSPSPSEQRHAPKRPPRRARGGRPRAPAFRTPRRTLRRCASLS